MATTTSLGYQLSTTLDTVAGDADHLASALLLKEEGGGIDLFSHALTKI